MTLPFLSYVQMDASARKTVQPTMLGVAASVLAVMCKRMQQLTPNNVGTCSTSCYARRGPNNVGETVETDPTL